VLAVCSFVVVFLGGEVGEKETREGASERFYLFIFATAARAQKDKRAAQEKKDSPSHAVLTVHRNCVCVEGR
jgi:hypothetical protein